MQLTLLDRGEAPVWRGLNGRVRRRWLDDACWIDLAPGVVGGHAAAMAELQSRLAWLSADRRMYDRRVAVPRLLASACPAELGPTAGPLVAAMHGELTRHYATALPELTFAFYRDGEDSVAWHRDRELRDWPEAIVAIVSLGGPRRFQVRPFDLQRGQGRGSSFGLNVGWGDLLVMGGACQHRFEHAVPKMAHAEPRMAIMFRPRGPARGQAEVRAEVQDSQATSRSAASPSSRIPG